jgi:hypothetical protein
LFNKNKGPKTLVYKNAVGGKNGFTTFRIHTDFTHIGGGTSEDQDLLLNKDLLFILKELLLLVLMKFLKIWNQR